MTSKNKLKYFAYVSETKVNQLYEQIGGLHRDTIEVERVNSNKKEGSLGLSNILSLIQANVSAGKEQAHKLLVKGEIPLMQKLQCVTEHINQHEIVRDLKEIIVNENFDLLNSFCFTLVGEFSVPKKHIWQMETIEEKRLGFSKVISPIITIRTRIKNFKIELSCSMRHFRTMSGEALSEEDAWMITPDSGNYQFFSGEISAHFESLIFLNGIKRKKLYGSPIYLVHQFSPDIKQKNNFSLRF